MSIISTPKDASTGAMVVGLILALGLNFLLSLGLAWLIGVVFSGAPFWPVVGILWACKLFF
jgi:hypothetical protein